MWIEAFFKPDDKKIKDKCPVCGFKFGTAFIKMERIYYCDECKALVTFYPNETDPHLKLVSKKSFFHVDYQPFDEDYQLHMQDPRPDPPNEDPPQNPRKWWF